VVTTQKATLTYDSGGKDGREVWYRQARRSNGSGNGPWDSRRDI
jgi:hypothetical protein